MAIRYQPTGTVKDTMQLAYKVGQKQARARQADEQAQYARQRADRLRKARREQQMVAYNDQLKLKAQQQENERALQKFQMQEDIKFQMEMERLQAKEALRMKKELEQEQKYMEAITFIHESDDIDEAAKPQLISQAKFKYLLGSTLGMGKQQDQFSMMMQQLMPNPAGPQGEEATQTPQAISQPNEIKVMKKSTGQIGYLPANEMTDDYVRVP